MGLIRKGASISTLGIISYRSKKERLQRAEKAHRSAEKSLLEERSARSSAEARIDAAEKRVRHAQTEAAHAAKQLAKSRRKRHQRRASQASATFERLMASAEPSMRERVDTLLSAGTDAAEKGRRSRRRAHKEAKKHAATARQAAEKAARRSAKRAQRAAEKAAEKLDDLAST